MKKVLILIACIATLNTLAQTQAFDATLNLNMGVRSHQNSGLSIQAGINGRRIPASLLVGASYMEFQDYSKYQESKVGLNATAMIRLAHMEFRSMDLNVYSTIHKYDKDIFQEYGAKIGILINDRSRIYLSVGEMKGNEYRSVIIGAHFSLFFFNGYSAY